MRSECLNSTFTLRVRIAVSHRFAPSTLRVDRSTGVVKSPKTIFAARSTTAKKSEKLRVRAVPGMARYVHPGISQAPAGKSTRTLTHRDIALYRIRISA